ncbi:MAG: hypothetical protein H6Q43_3210, partial [Deltaproteobacteria bacterium]|nr:hypothetical protein [Deltaproteobacteria bacterium]
GLIHQADVSDLLRQVCGRLLRRGNEPGADGRHNLHIRAVGLVQGIYPGAKSGIHQFHRPQKPDGTRSENDRVELTRVILEVA